MPVTQHHLLSRVLHDMARDGSAAIADGELLQRFLTQRDETAFTALVWRHGPMVLGVCRRVLGNDADAEDAFQATFLVLVRKATSLRTRTVLGDWLHGVARRTALKAKCAAARRRAKEQESVRPVADQGEPRNDWLPLLDQELSQLPEKYRSPLVLCDLEGRTRGEAAAQLGWPEGTVAGRLARGRAMLAKRLFRHARVLVGALSLALIERVVRAAVSPTLADTTARAAAALVASEGSPRVVLPFKTATPWRVGLATLMTATLLGVGAFVFAPPPQDTKGAPPAVPADAPKKPDTLQGVWKVKEADANGKHLPQEVSTTQVWTITDKAITIQYDNGDKQELTYRFDATVTPHTIALNWTSGYRKGYETLGIWERTGNRLRICWGGDPPPTEFVDQFESRAWRYYVLEPLSEPAENPPGALVRIGNLRLTHQAGVSWAAFAPDGKTLATAGHDNYVRLWSRGTCREVHALRHYGWVRSLVWAPDSKTLYSSSDNEGIRQWDAATGKELWRRKVSGMVTALALTADAKTLAWVEPDKTVVVWDIPGDKEHYRFQVDERAYRIAFSPDGKTLVVGGEPKIIRRRETATGRELPSFEGHAEGTYAVAFSPDGKLLASGGTYPEGMIHLWDTASGKELRRWKASANAVYGLAFGPEGKTLLSGHGGDAEPMRLWDVANGRELRSFAGPVGLVDAIAMTADGTAAVSAGCHDRGIHLWDVATGKETFPYPRHHGEVSAAAFAPDGKLLATGNYDRTVGLWEPDTGRLAGRLDRHGGAVLAVAFSPDGKLVATSAETEKKIRLWSTATRELVRECMGGGGRFDFPSLAFSPDGTKLAAGEYMRDVLPSGAAPHNGAVRLWDVATGKEIHRLESKAGRVSAVAFSPDGRILASAGIDDETIHLWDVKTGQELTRLERKTDLAAPQAMFEGTAALAFAPDGRSLAALSFYEHKSNRAPIPPARENDVRMVSLWEIATGTIRHEVHLPRNSVRSLVFLDRRFLALGGADGTIHLQDLARNEGLPTAHGHRDRVAALAVSPDGRTLASGSWDTTALVWRTAALTGQRPLKEKPRTAEELDTLWMDLAGVNAVRACRAVWLLATAPECVALLEKHVKPVPEVDEKRIKALVADLDSDDFRVRDKATAELRMLRELAAPALREVLGAKPSLEVRRRAEEMLSRIESGTDEAVALRAMEVLESLATPEAKRFLGVLAKGASTARQTREAKTVLQRLEPR